ncbi:dynein regulatory complex subunit 3 isoform X1 [Scophthalmus maximus]|uniref:dynein regulatory complex subunit 3 isoform X1 n=2 Tax=Scophthalmus maximus TaxID=52904 RepID=UPI001FA908C8|nr:dynein regulatory complex subunit 3 isoform X1 [Scophthalmus maximus]
MSRQFANTAACSLIDEEILKKAVFEQTLHDQAKSIAKTEGIHFDEVLKIRLEYKHIVKIDHLWDFTSLTRLDLNNNIIERMEGLDSLMNLTWLNLSFNRIEKMEGLESLQRLELLNLSNNRISVIENMDGLEKLSHFFIANNLLEQLDNVLYLRKFKNLFTLNLFGNPVSKENYTFFIAAYFPNLTCLDYRLLNDKTKNEAAVKYHYIIEEMRHNELQKQQADDAEQSRKAELQSHTDAFVEFLNGAHLFNSMFNDDPEAETIQSVTGVDHLVRTFEHQMVELCMKLFEIGLAEHKRRQTEVNSFFSGQTRAVTDHQQKASQILAKFEQQHQERIVELHQLSDPDKLKVNLSQYNDDISQLCNSLMSLEYQLANQLEDIIEKLDINISDMVSNFTETVQGIFVECRALEDIYNKNIREIADATLKKVATESPEDDMPEEVKMLFSDKDSVMDALVTGHDNHLLKINDRETQLVARVSAWKVSLIKEFQDKELKRNCLCIKDIHRYVGHVRGQLEEFQ